MATPTSANASHPLPGNTELAGPVPNPPAPDAIADTLIELLGCSITPADLGWPAGSADDRGLLVEVDPSRTLRAVAGLTGRKMNRRHILRGAAAVGAVAFSDAALHSLAGSYYPVAATAGSGRRVGVVEVALIRETTIGLRGLDARYGVGKLLDDAMRVADEIRGLQERLARWGTAWPCASSGSAPMPYFTPPHDRSSRNCGSQVDAVSRRGVSAPCWPLTRTWESSHQVVVAPALSVRG